MQYRNVREIMTYIHCKGKYEFNDIPQKMDTVVLETMKKVSDVLKKRIENL